MLKRSTPLQSLDIALWIVVLFWGANYVIGKWGMLGFDPVTFNLLRFLGATPALFLLPELALVGLVGITLYHRAARRLPPLRW